MQLKIEKTQDLGTKELAYPISKNQQGHYLFSLLPSYIGKNFLLAIFVLNDKRASLDRNSSAIGIKNLR